jgi:hypothetical protein
MTAWVRFHIGPGPSKSLTAWRALSRAAWTRGPGDDERGVVVGIEITPGNVNVR